MAWFGRAGLSLSLSLLFLSMSVSAFAVWIYFSAAISFFIIDQLILHRLSTSKILVIAPLVRHLYILGFMHHEIGSNFIKPSLPLKIGGLSTHVEGSLRNFYTWRSVYAR